MKSEDSVKIRESVLQKCLIPALEELRTQSSRGSEFSFLNNAPLYGNGGPLDSIDLVRLLILVEERIRKEFHQSVRLASLKGVVGEAKPFSDIASLADYASSFLQ